MKERVINNTANKKNKTMPNFPKNTNSFMKYSKKGSSFPFKSPMKRDNQSWEAAGVGQEASKAAKKVVTTKSKPKLTQDEKRSKEVKDRKDIVGMNSPGDGYVKLKGTSIWEWKPDHQQPKKK